MVCRLDMVEAQITSESDDRLARFSHEVARRGASEDLRTRRADRRRLKRPVAYRIVLAAPN